MEVNFYILFGSAVVPILIGAIWYNPKVFGTIWMNQTGLTEEQLRKANMPLIFGLTYVFGLFLSAGIMPLVVHQMHISSLLMAAPGFGEEGSEISLYIQNFLESHGTRHRSFGHGALHGGIAAVFFALPVLGINALFERKSWSYILLHLGYWFVTLALMGGVICQFV